MAKLPDSRMTLANVMLVIAAVALLLGLALNPSLGSALVFMMILVPSSLLGCYLIVRRIVELMFGIPCPGCHRRGLERRSILSFGDRYFLCPNCGVRCRQSLIGAILGLYLWTDASGGEYAVYYQKPETLDPWNAPPGLEDEYESATSKTHANLVRNKRLRKPDNPNGPGLE